MGDAKPTNDDGFEFTFYCKMHKYLLSARECEPLEINVDNLGMHVLEIKKLQCKLDKINLTQERINEYELLQRGIVNQSANPAVNRKHKKKRKQKVKYGDDGDDNSMSDFSMNSVTRKRKRSKSKTTKRSKSKSRMKRQKRSQSRSIDDDDDEKHEYTQRATRSLTKKSEDKQIRMATDIWAEQYRYAGGEIKWPVEKRDGWFMTIPRLKLPKGNKFRYSHKERKAKQALIQKEKGLPPPPLPPAPLPPQNDNSQWMSFMDAIKEKEAELKMEQKKEEKQNLSLPLGRKEQKMGGEDWDFVENLNFDPTSIDAATCKVCPLCNKTKHANVSKPNWIKHLNAKHQFRCKKCKLIFTRH